MGRKPKENNQVDPVISKKDDKMSDVLELLASDVCAKCKHLDNGTDVEKVTPGIGIIKIKEYYCCRYPTNIKKQLSDHCGEFARKE